MKKQLDVRWMINMSDQIISEEVGVSFEEKRHATIRNRQHQALNHALRMSGLTEEQALGVIRPPVSFQKQPSPGDNRGKRSDSESIFLFDDDQVALDALDYALSLGLPEGMVTFDEDFDMKYKKDVYVIRFSPAVKMTNPNAYKEFVLSMAEVFADDEEDAIWFQEEIESIEEANYATARQRDFWNIYHGKDGKFSKLDLIKSKDGGQGSASKPNSINKKTNMGRQAQVNTKKKPPFTWLQDKVCGRKARAQGKVIRCWDMKQGSEVWKSWKSYNKKKK